MSDLFKFWDGLSGNDAHIHPADRDVLDCVDHQFSLECFAEPFRGRLQTAPVVFLFLAPGLDERDLARSPEAHAFWAKRIVKQFDVEYESVRSKFAFLNIAPYRSKSFSDLNMLVALPSARMAVGWAQAVLFPEAKTGKRVVVCLRSQRYWGLGKQPRIGESLFAPRCNRGGIMLRDETRRDVVSAVTRAINL